MEGFLMKKGRGEGGIFGRKNWKKRWFILEGTYITYYESFNLETNEPVNKKGTAPVRGCKIELDLKSDKKFGFVMSHETRKPLHMDAETEKIRDLWIKALREASTGVVGPRPVTINFSEFYDRLGMERDVPYTEVELNKSYRKAALKNHPDKGGDVEVFKAVQEAFEVLKARLEEQEEEKLWTFVDFVATVCKGKGGVGFGMSVMVDTKTAHIVAKEIFVKKMILIDIEPASGGSIKPRDHLVKIDNDDIATWTMTRVTQRLNDFRAPVGTNVKFTFRRCVRIDGSDSESASPWKSPAASAAAASSFEEDERIFQEQQARQQREEEEARRHTAAAFSDDGSSTADTEQQQQQQQQGGAGGHREGDINDIDEDDDSYDINDIDEGAADSDDGHSSAQHPQHDGEGRVPQVHMKAVAEEREQHELKRHQEEESQLEQEQEERRVQERERRSEERASMDPFDQIASLMAENDALEAALTALRLDLKAAKSFEAQFHQAVLDLEEARSESRMFLEQLEAAELESQAASRREMAAMDVVNQLHGARGMPAEVSQQVLKDVREAADLVQRGCDLTGEYGYSLQDSVLLPDDLSVEYAQKNALSAAMMVDKSGVFSQKYDQDSLSSDLMARLEKSLRALTVDSLESEEEEQEGAGRGWVREESLEYPGRRSFESGQHHGSGHGRVSGGGSTHQPQHRRPPPPPRRHVQSQQEHYQQPNVYGSMGGNSPFANDMYHDEHKVAGGHRDSRPYTTNPKENSRHHNDQNGTTNSTTFMSSLASPTMSDYASSQFSSPITFGPRKKVSKLRNSGLSAQFR